MLVESFVMHPLNQSLITFLLSPAALHALDDLALEDLGEAALLPLLMQLRKTFSREEAAVLVDQARFRRKGLAKFPEANQLLFIDEALEQASSLAVAAYRAKRFGNLEWCVIWGVEWVRIR